MKPITFSEQNHMYAKDQPEYLPLPCFKAKDGTVVSCWSLTLKERIKILVTGRMWWIVLTFNQQLQPHCPCVDKPLSQATPQQQAVPDKPHPGPPPPPANVDLKFNGPPPA